MNESQRTTKFLQLIARRLSGREDCKKVEFTVGICIRFPGSDKITSPQILDNHYIFFSPSLRVYQDMYHRKDKDLKNIVDLVIEKYFPELMLGYDLFGSRLVDTSKLVPGVYEYKLSVNGKRRKWIKNPNFVIDNKRPIKFFTYRGVQEHES